MSLVVSATCVQYTDNKTDLLNSNDAKKPIISTPYDPIHLTHVGFDYNTGQCEYICTQHLAFWFAGTGD